MERKTVHILYGRGRMDLSVPAAAAVLHGTNAPVLADPATALRAALAMPMAAPPLLQLLRERHPANIAITISDITRPVPNRLILPVLLETINTAGIEDGHVHIIIATGMHRPSTPAEREELVGPEILRRCKVTDHRADEASALVRVSDSPPVSVNRAFASAAFRIVTGLIEPHFMAGFSGGRKGVCPGLVDLATVQRLHDYRTLADPRSDTGILDGNPCHQEALRVARLVGVDYLVNVALDRDRRVVGVYCGDMEAAHEQGCRDVAGWNSAVVPKPFDLVVSSGGGYPLDQTFYQTVKGIVAALPALHERSTLLVASPCAEGIGSPPYTQVMARWGGDWRGFLLHIAAMTDPVKDQWQYQMHIRVLERIGRDRLWFVCDGLTVATQRQLGVWPVDGAGDARTCCQRAIDGFLGAYPTASVAVLPDGPYTMLQRT